MRLYAVIYKAAAPQLQYLPCVILEDSHTGRAPKTIRIADTRRQIS